MLCAAICDQLRRNGGKMKKIDIRRERIKKGSVLGLVFLMYLLLAAGMILAEPDAQPQDPQETESSSEIEPPQPSTPEQTEPSTPEQTEPSTPEQTEPSTPEPPQPSTPEQTEPPQPTQPEPTPPQPTEPPHTHQYTVISRSEPTCTEIGVIVYQCSCGASYQETVPVSGHSFVQRGVEATYGAAGYIEIVCSVCGYVRQRTEVPALVLASPTIHSVEAGEQGVVITWNAVDQAEGYYIYRKVETESQWQRIGTVDNAGLSFEDDTAKAGYSYHYAVSQYRVIDGETFSSPEGYNKKKFLLSFRAPVLNEPEIGEGGILISWMPVLGADGYVIYRMDENGKWADLRSVSGQNRTSYVDSQVSKGQTCTYTVKAYSRYQGAIKWGIYDEEGVTITINQLDVSFQSLQTMRALWQRQKEEIFCQLYIRDKDGKWTNRNAGIVYMADWRETSDVEKGKAVWAMKIPKAAMDAPVLLEVQSSKGTVEIRWNVLSGIDGYCIERKAEGEDWTEVAKLSDADLDTWTDAEITYGTRYVYRIRAYRESEEGWTYSDYSNDSYSITIRLLSGTFSQ